MAVTPAQSPVSHILGIVNKANGSKLTEEYDRISSGVFYPEDPSYGECTVFIHGIDPSGISGNVKVMFSKRFLREKLEEDHGYTEDYDQYNIVAIGKTVDQALNEVATKFGLWRDDLYCEVDELPKPTNGTHVSKLEVFSKKPSVLYCGSVYIYLCWEDHGGLVDIGDWISDPELNGWASVQPQT